MTRLGVFIAGGIGLAVAGGVAGDRWLAATPEARVFEAPAAAHRSC